MISWRDVRSIDELQNFVHEFAELAEVDKDAIRTEMAEEIVAFKLIEVIHKDLTPRQVEDSLRLPRRKRRRQI